MLMEINHKNMLLSGTPLLQTLHLWLLDQVLQKSSLVLSRPLYNLENAQESLVLPPL